ncbi:hypothetical protein MSTE_00077 [Mycobacteroides stephanolepidis]|uniref:Uncharacterized protein n=1 Tax=[Mycobacterium] stephanolepidis TaxID=1520670 RepID=A0A1Z4ER42_9MYCO|nr:hypothetical protein MSTE_00077 [[Mycobacterium] stephanolepidis]
MAATSSPDEPNLAATSWTILGMLSYEEEVSGYDIKKWADWSISYFYWSPSPVTRAPSVTRRTSEVPVQSGIPARSTPANSPAARACPPAR